MLIQALGLAWVALALAFYAFPLLMLGRGISLIALPLALGLMVGWRISIHWLLGHPDFGEKILIVGSGPLAIEVAREMLERPDAGYRIAGFVANDPELLGKSLINPRVIGLTSELDEVVRREGIDRIIVAMGERRGQLPTNELLHLSLAGTVNIERGRVVLRTRHRARFAEHDSAVVADLSGRGRQTRISGIARNIVHRLVAVVGGAAVVAHRLSHGNSDQARFTRTNFLQAGTSREKRRLV